MEHLATSFANKLDMDKIMQGFDFGTDEELKVMISSDYDDFSNCDSKPLTFVDPFLQSPNDYHTNSGDNLNHDSRTCK